MYTERNFATKKALKEAVQAYLNNDPKAYPVTYYQPGPFGGNEPKNGTIHVEGPHSPKPHKWYAECEVKGGAIVKVK